MNMYEGMEQLGIRICPICGKEYTDYPAISRKDNKTEICPRCGVMESLDRYVNEHMQNKEKDNLYCKDANRICRYHVNGECKAPNIFAMPCVRPCKEGN